MKGYWTGYCYVGIMPNGEKRYFVNREEAQEAYDHFYDEE